MRREGLTRVIKIVGLIAASVTIVLVLRFLLNVTESERRELIVTQAIGINGDEESPVASLPEDVR